MIAARGAAVILAVLASGCGVVDRFALGQQLKTGAGVAAKQLCSLAFVSELEPDRARALYIDPMLRGGGSVLWMRLDRDGAAASARILGLFSQRAAYREGYGCTLVHDPERGLQPVTRTRASSRPMALDRAHRAAAFDPARLDAAIERAFLQDPEQPPANTLAVVVLHEGALVAESYADGIEAETRLPGWSMTKSVTATLIGLLAFRGRLDLYAPGAIREWRDSEDPRSRIALDHLLRMISGLAITEDADRGDGTDPNSLLLYHEPDAARFAATRALDREIGSHFEYMSGNYVLAMRAAQEAIGGGLAEASEFVHEDLFSPLGMDSAVLEPDQSGTFLGSSHMLATARDWARFGQLYLDRGVAGGRRIVSEEWIDYVTTPTPQSTSKARGDVFWEPGRSTYGAGFWLFGPDEVTGLPPDSFDANGFQGQYVHIIPSKSLVVVRLGATNTREYDHNRLPREVIASLRH